MAGLAGTPGAWNEALGMQGLAMNDPWMASAAGTSAVRAMLTGDMTPWYQRTAPAAANPPAMRPPAVAGSGVSVSSGGGTGGGSINLGSLQNSGEFNAVGELIKGLIGQYSKDSAMSDARAMMDMRAQAERERQMPAIRRAMEGAGTSAGSMQALMSQKLATDIATQSAALGAEQAKAYGGIQSSLANALSGLASSGDPMTKLLSGLMQTQMNNQTSRDVAAMQAETAKSAGGGNAALTSAINQYALGQQTNALKQQQLDNETMMIQMGYGRPTGNTGGTITTGWSR